MGGGIEPPFNDCMCMRELRTPTIAQKLSAPCHSGSCSWSERLINHNLLHVAVCTEGHIYLEQRLGSEFQVLYRAAGSYRLLFSILAS